MRTIPAASEWKKSGPNVYEIMAKLLNRNTWNLLTSTKQENQYSDYYKFLSEIKLNECQN